MSTVTLKYLNGDSDTMKNAEVTKNTYGVATIESGTVTLYVNMAALRFLREEKTKE